MDDNADILIVDDTIANLKILSAILKEGGYLVRPATNAELALKAIQQRSPDLIMLDIRMPSIDGYEFCEVLKSDTKLAAIPVIFVSALGGVDDKTKAFAMGGSDYIIRPFHPDEVRARVATHLKAKRYQDYMKSMVEEGLTKIQSLNDELVDTQRELLFMVSEVCESRSRETGQHVKRVSEFSYLLAKLVGCHESECILIRDAAPMHDVGKVAIRDQILNKPGQLNDDEWRIMKTHPTVGYDMLSASNRPMIQMAATIAHEHHEKWDGSGYPRGLHDEAISIAGRIVACADVFDALACERCYKNAWPIDEVIDYFRSNKGTHFDPSLVDLLVANKGAFMDIMGRLKG